MGKLMFKVKTVLTMSIIIMMAVVVFVDADMLNSLVIINGDELLIEEVVLSGINSNNSSAGQLVAFENKVLDNEVVLLDVAYDDYWAWPTESNYIITSYYGSRWGSNHQAIDISGAGYGSNIYAANNGTVVTVKGGCVTGNMSCNGKGGNYIVINHNKDNYYTVYMHLKDIKVSEGQVVSRGQVIGTMGNTGNVVPRPTTSKPYSGTHLHFALYIGEPYNGGYAVNPMRLY